LKIVREQEFVVGGWTEPRQTRAYFGALLLGVYERGQLVDVGPNRTGVRRPPRPRVQGARARSADEAPEAAGNKEVSVQRATTHERTATLGETGARRPNQIYGRAGGWKAAPSGLPRPAR